MNRKTIDIGKLEKELETAVILKKRLEQGHVSDSIIALYRGRIEVYKEILYGK